MAILVPSTANTTFANAASIVITKPTGLAAGDVLFAAIYVTSGTVTVTTPSGWTQLAVEAQTASGQHTLTTLYKVADSADAAATNFTFNLSGTTQVSGALLRITGAAFTTLISGNDHDSVTNGTLTFTGGLTPQNASSLLIMCAGVCAAQQNGDLNAFAIANDNPSWTEVFEDERNLTDGNNLAWAISYAIRTQTTASGNYSFNDGGYSNVNIDSVGQLICINPAISITVSPSVIEVAGAVQAPAIAGGATIAPAVITSSGTVQAPSKMGQADWSSVQKSSTPTWNSQTKS
jgi:hypothetical protein